MSTRVLIADDSDIMRSAIRRMLEEQAKIDVVGEAENFAKTIQMVGDLKPDVLLLDLRMPDDRDLRADLIKAQLGCVCTLAVSFSNDDEARDLARSYGAVALLDKMKLFNEIVPAIMRCKSRDSDIGNLLRKPYKRRTRAT
jgi:DNA-binding NarL/FixJ family response regulator